VIFYKDEPVYVTNVWGRDDDIRIKYVSLDNLRKWWRDGDVGDIVKQAALDEDFRWDNFKLGYVQINDRACYVSRMPYRQWRKGLSRGVVHLNFDSDHMRLDWQRWMGEPLKKCLLDDYPTFEEAVDKLDKVLDKNADLGYNPSIAFNRYLSLSLDGLGITKLLYKTEPIAYGDDKKVFKLGVHHSYFKEMLTNYGVKLNV
jgi:hypothetical protein